MKLKYCIDLADVEQLSATSQSDTLVVLHVLQDKEKKSTSKGDHMFYCPSLIEFATRLDLAYRKYCNNKRLEINLSDSFEIHIDRRGSTMVEIERGDAEEEEVRGVPRGSMG